MVDPHHGTRKDYPDEDHAYAAFQAAGGMDAYVERCLEKILAGPAPRYLLGFSAGASALWKALGQVPEGTAERAQLFYGGQIRHFPDCQPACPVHLVFPAREALFSVEELMMVLQGRPRVTMERTPFLHGFMNPLSRNFEPPGLELFTARIIQELRAISVRTAP